VGRKNGGGVRIFIISCGGQRSGAGGGNACFPVEKGSIADRQEQEG